jgi:6-phosphogluconolactonase
MGLSGPKIDMVSDSEALAAVAMDLFLDCADEAMGKQGFFRIAVSGGRTPKRFFELVAHSDRGQQLSWDKVQLFWTDERFVPADHEQSNYRMTRESLLTHVPIPEGNVFRIPTECESACQTAVVYEQTLREVFQLEPGQWPVFDLVLLGMGADGHTASLFPNTYAPFNDEDLVCGVLGAPGGLQRVSLTAPVLCAARKVAVLVAGDDKADTIKRVLQGPFNKVVTPIHVLEPIWSRVHWVLDQAAAKHLS